MAILKAAATHHLRLAAKGISTESIPVEFADDAAQLLSRWRDSNCLGSSDFKRGCGDVTDHQGKLVAWISYNGRIWNLEGKTVSL